MKEIGIGAGVLGMACGVWMAFQGGFSLGNASRAPFNYDTATVQERTDWLNEQAEPVEKTLKRSLPSGYSPTAIRMNVKDVTVDARRRTIVARINVSGPYHFDKRSVPTLKKKMTEQICPNYVKSEIGKNKVHLQQSFIGRGGREELTLVISPITCRKYI